MLKLLIMAMIMMIMKPKNMKSTVMIIIMIMNLSLQNSMPQKMSYIFMGDQLSFWNTNLVMWMLFILMFMNISNSNLHKQIMTTSTILFTMIFYTWNFLSFYILFEMTMIIMMMIMMNWSYQPERTEAIMFLVIMTLMFSLPFLVMMMNNINQLNYWFIKLKLTTWDYLSFLIIFMMKMPFYFIHFWLPKVHVEAPIQGSMILAAIMLKLGCYGMIRMMPVMKCFKLMNMVISVVAMWSMVILSMTCFIQTDIKTLVAYSSIVHMTMLLVTMLINKKKSIYSSIMIIVSHGMCASGLFFMANMFYKKSKSRSIIMNKGMTKMMPLMTIMWFILCMSNTPMPPAISILGEIVALKMILEWTDLMTMIFLMSLMSSLYSIFMFYVLNHSKQSSLLKMKSKTEMSSIVILSLHTAPLIMLSWKMKMLMIL